MRNLLLFLLAFLSSGLCKGQQDKQMTHYFFDRMSFNPSATGFSGVSGMIIYRNQWDKVQDAPNTTLFNAQANIPRHNLGLGFSFVNDVIGFQKNNSATINVARHFPTSVGILSGGIGIGLINVGFTPSWQPPQTLNDPNIPDPTSDTGFDMNIGLYWHGTTAPYYVGVSSTHIKPPSLTNINFSVARHYYVIAGYNLSVPAARRTELKPSVLLKSDGTTTIFDVNVMADHWLNSWSYIWGGISYRLSDAFAVNIGYAKSMSRNPKIDLLKIGYSYDKMTNPMRAYGYGSHELILDFHFFPPPKGFGRHGNPFILE